jgi:hypothetical protein
MAASGPKVVEIFPYDRCCLLQVKIDAGQEGGAFHPCNERDLQLLNGYKEESLNYGGWHAAEILG